MSTQLKSGEHYHSEKRCKDFLLDLSLYIDKEATAQLCEAIERHLVDCADCQVVVDTLSRTIRLYHTLPEPEMPDRLRERLYRTLDLSEFLNLPWSDGKESKD
jgi:hypothetical protein